MERILPPQYADGELNYLIYSTRVFTYCANFFKGIWAPREWPGLPPVDTVSRIVQDVDYPDNQLTITVMHWGQLVAHDVTHVPTFRTCKLIHFLCF